MLRRSLTALKASKIAAMKVCLLIFCFRIASDLSPLATKHIKFLAKRCNPGNTLKSIASPVIIAVFKSTRSLPIYDIDVCLDFFE